jgi:hypothetical protein
MSSFAFAGDYGIARIIGVAVTAAFGTEFGGVFVVHFPFFSQRLHRPRNPERRGVCCFSSCDSFLLLPSARFSFAADMYCLGIVAYQLASAGVFMLVNIPF